MFLQSSNELCGDLSNDVLKTEKTCSLLTSGAKMYCVVCESESDISTKKKKEKKTPIAGIMLNALAHLF